MTTTTDYLACIRTGDWLDAQTFPPLRWAVPEILPEGFGLLTGPPKAGKSWLVYGLLLAIASGKPALGRVATGWPRPVLFLALEDGDRRMQRRARHLLGEGVAIPSNLHYTTVATHGDAIPIIEAWLEVYGDKAPLVVLDTLGKVMPPAMPGEGAYQRDYRIGSRLKRLADDQPGTCLLVIHHTRKLGSLDWMDSTSGSNGLNGAADFTVNLERARNEDAGVLRVTGRDVTEAEYAVVSDAGRWTVDGGSLADAARLATERRSEHGLGDRSAEVVAYVRQHPQGVRAGEVAEALGLDGKTAGTYLGRLEDAGRIRRPSRGLYTPVESVGSVESEPDSTLSTLSTALLDGPT
ncbi:AAA family ATPase [Demequina rhizosphaerae]|uniref:AAA family ATPase n=1 Tax=Demequina rhizosphaerae TaxID=1638985 RepID=UPI0007849E9C|nr:AAA family ATPase [Demequina rhizosphaerae]